MSPRVYSETVTIRIADIPEVIDLIEKLKDAIDQALYHLTDPYKAPEMQRQLAIESLTIEWGDEPTTCPHGDPTCPCPDGLACHYEGDEPMACPTTRRVGCFTCRPTSTAAKGP